MNRVPTRQPLPRRLWSAMGDAVDAHPWLPMAVALVALLIVNS